jgi:hypothetical protein
MPGWQWTVLDVQCEEAFQAVKNYLESRGHSYPPTGYVEGGINLGRWIGKQRSAFLKNPHNPLFAERASRLESLPGWVWRVDLSQKAFETGFAALLRFAEKEGHAFVPRGYVDDGIDLGVWISNRRSRKGRLSPDQISRLNSLPLWTWNANDEAWEVMYAVLGRFVGRTGHARVPTGHQEEGNALGTWVTTQRRDFSRSRLSRERGSMLDRLPGWVWNTRTDTFQTGYAALLRFVEKEGHPFVPRGYIDGGIDLGRWLLQRRSTAGRKRLTPEQVCLFEKLPRWNWNANDGAWEIGYTALRQYVEREGHARVPAGHEEDGYHLYTWVGTQRGNRSDLSLEQVSRLEMLSGWVWNTKRDMWDTGYATLLKYVKREGHCHVPRGHVEDGIRLESWVSNQRRRKEQWTSERIEQLEKIPGWVWNTGKEPILRWETKYDVLLRYVEREGHARVPKRHVEDGVPIGNWVISRRRDFRNGILSAQRVARLESLPGWVWSVRGTE